MVILTACVKVVVAAKKAEPRRQWLVL